MIQSLYWHERRSALVLNQEHHQEFGWLCTAGVPVDVDIVRALMEGLSGCQCELFSTLPLHHNGALEYVDNRNGEGYHVQSGVACRVERRVLQRDRRAESRDSAENFTLTSSAPP